MIRLISSLGMIVGDDYDLCLYILDFHKHDMSFDYQNDLYTVHYNNNRVENCHFFHADYGIHDRRMTVNFL